MEEFLLKDIPKNTTCFISKCLAPENSEVYRLLEMGIYKGAMVTVLKNFPTLGAMELLVKKSRICIAYELADQFLVTYEPLS